MPVPNTIADLNQTAASNFPLGTDTVGPNLDDYLRSGFAFTRQMFDGTANSLGSVSGTDTITATCPVPFTAYVQWQTFRFIPAGANTTTTPTLNINGLGAKTLLKFGSTVPQPGDLAAGSIVQVVYDGTQFQIVSVTPPTKQSQPSRFINGGMLVDQRNGGASQIIVAGAALAYTVDRWYAYCTGANVGGQQVAGSGSALRRYRFTGAPSVTGIGFGQRIEAANSSDMASSTIVFGVDLANSLLTTVTWTAYYANTTDTFGTLAAPTRTQIATGTFTVNSTVSRYTATVNVPAAATTGIEVVFSVGAQTSGTWTIGSARIEPGTFAAPYQEPDISDTWKRCQYYREQSSDTVGLGVYASGLGQADFIRFLSRKRINPAVTANPSSFTSVGFTSLNQINTALNGFRYVFNTPSPQNTIGAGVITWAADAEL